MSGKGSMNGKYYKTAWHDIKSSPGWVGKIFLLGLINFIPIFGQMTVYGYAYEWGHKAAWEMEGPMPKKIYGRKNSKMLRWGWFAIVISFVCELIPSVISSIGNAMSTSGTAVTTSALYGGHGSYALNAATGTNAALATFGGLLSFVGFVAALAGVFFVWAGIMRMMMYDRLGAGLQFGQIWKMIRRDFGGLLRILGMALLVGLVVGIIYTIIMSIIASFVIGLAVAGAAAHSTTAMTKSAAMALVVLAAGGALPFILIFTYLLSVATVWIQLLVSRALGYWTRQFDVANWGKKDDPLPFETNPSAYAKDDETPVAPAGAAAATAAAAAATETPAQPEVEEERDEDAAPEAPVAEEEPTAEPEPEAEAEKAEDEPAFYIPASEASADADDDEATKAPTNEA